MGIYLNPSTELFQRSLNSAIYVDKSELLSHLKSLVDTEQCYVAISRPRRFGKTMALKMAAAYYGYGLDSAALFDGLAITRDPSFSRFLNHYDVLYITMSDVSTYQGSMKERLKRLEKRITEELANAYTGVLTTDDLEGEIFEILPKVCEHTGRKFIFMIDEWDCLMREKNDIEAQKVYLDWLRNLLKDKPYIALAYMTGILPIKKYGTHSTLNMFSEYSMLDPGALAPYFGFTEEEVKPLCERFQMSFEGARAYYNGYRLSYKLPGEERKKIAIYSPKSIVESMLHQKFGNYWNQTETYEALSVYIKMNIAGVKDDVVKMLTGESIPIMVDTFQNDLFNFHTKDQLYTLLIHLGYLTFDEDEETVCIPNREVGEVFKLSALDAGMGEVAMSIEHSKRLLQAVWNGDEKAVADAVDTAHQSVSILDYNNEKALSYTLSLAFYYAAEYYTVIRELPTGKGFADLAFIPREAHRDKPAMIIELKVERSAQAAIAQIKNKNYPAALADYLSGQASSRDVLLVGINYSKKTKKHSCKIERLG
jgi:hypothetical protein